VHEVGVYETLHDEIYRVVCLTVLCSGWQCCCLAFINLYWM